MSDLIVEQGQRLRPPVRVAGSAPGWRGVTGTQVVIGPRAQALQDFYFDVHIGSDGFDRLAMTPDLAMATHAGVQDIPQRGASAEEAQVVALASAEVKARALADQQNSGNSGNNGQGSGGGRV